MAKTKTGADYLITEVKTIEEEMKDYLKRINSNGSDSESLFYEKQYYRTSDALQKKQKEAYDAVLNELETVTDEDRKNQLRQDKEYLEEKRPEFRYIMPVEKGNISSLFSYRFVNAEFHWGWDIANNSGEDVVAIGDGKVYLAAYGEGTGNWVVIQHEDPDIGTFYSIYMHMQEGLKVSSGESVERGQTIGNVGNTGGKYGYHLHFQVSPTMETTSKRNSQSFDPFTGIIAKSTELYYNGIYHTKHFTKSAIEAVSGWGHQNIAGMTDFTEAASIKANEKIGLTLESYNR